MKHVDLIEWTMQGNVEMLEKAFNKGAPVNIKGGPDLLPFAVSGYIDDPQQELATVNLLIERGANVNTESKGQRSALDAAATRSSPEVIKALIEGGADPMQKNVGGFTPYQEAIASGNTENAEVIMHELARREQQAIHRAVADELTADESPYTALYGDGIDVESVGQQANRWNRIRKM